jgi:hypothetical protein
LLLKVAYFKPFDHSQDPESIGYGSLFFAGPGPETARQLMVALSHRPAGKFDLVLQFHRIQLKRCGAVKLVPLKCFRHWIHPRFLN